MNMYVRLSEGLNKYQLIPKESNVWDYIKDPDNKDYYQSIYYYTQDHYNHWKKTKSLAGITNVKTDKLVFDLDDAKNPENAKNDALTLITKLIQMGIPKEGFEIEFSGNKGFSIEVPTTSKFSPEELKTLALNLTEGLKTRDSSVYDPQRIFRIPGTKHNKSGLYKFPITLDQLTTLTIDQIKTLAKDYNNVDKNISVFTVDLPQSVINLKDKKKVEKSETLFEYHDSLDLSSKPKFLSAAKYALQEGFFKEGERSLSLTILAATYKSLGFNQDICYRYLKGVAEVQAKRNNSDRFPDNEIWNNIIKVVYSPSWKGGTFSQANTELLQTVSKRLGLPSDDRTEDVKPKFLTSVTDKFKTYVKNIEQNTIKTGIDLIDKHVFISTGANVAIVGAPGSAKSSIALEILRNTSRNGVKSVFASLDMSSTRIYEKVMYKLTGKKREELYDLFKNDKEGEVLKQLEDNFGNVFFYDRSMPSVQELKEYILACERDSGEKIKLVVLDYFERISSDLSEDTAASKKVAGELQSLVNDLDIALITLVQPNKMSGDMSQPIKSYTNIKGSSFLAQSFRIVMGIYREGFDPQVPENDKYLTLNILKNDLGETASLDFAWHGKRGEIEELDEYQKVDLAELRRSKKKPEDNF